MNTCPETPPPPQAALHGHRKLGQRLLLVLVAQLAARRRSLQAARLAYGARQAGRLYGAQEGVDAVAARALELRLVHGVPGAAEGGRAGGGEGGSRARAGRGAGAGVGWLSGPGQQTPRRVERGCRRWSARPTHAYRPVAWRRTRGRVVQGATTEAEGWGRGQGATAGPPTPANRATTSKAGLQPCGAWFPPRHPLPPLEAIMRGWSGELQSHELTLCTSPVTHPPTK